MKVLIFGTCYVDSVEKRDLLQQWITLNKFFNPLCDLMIVDSASPFMLGPTPCRVAQLGDNIGHLSRDGQDGWGRAFCTGLQYAIDKEYDYVVHIECDSLCCLQIWHLCQGMKHDELLVASLPVVGTKRVENNWVETGLMAFDVGYVDESNLIEEYNWRDGKSKKYPNTPEAVLWKLTQHYLHLWPFDGMRDDRGILTPKNVHEYQWISHTTPAVYDAFVKLHK